MDLAMEKKIAQAFLYKNKRERFIYDMTKKDKEIYGEISVSRFHALCKLETNINMSLSIMKTMKLPSKSEIIKTMLLYGANDKKCYTLSEYSSFDGVYIELDKAIDKLCCNGFPSLIIGLPSGFSFFKYESTASNQPNCFLKPLIRFDNIPWS